MYLKNLLCRIPFLWRSWGICKHIPRPVPAAP